MFGARRSLEDRSTVSAAKEVTNESHDEGMGGVFFPEGGGEGGGKDLMVFGKDVFADKGRMRNVKNN